MHLSFGEPRSPAELGKPIAGKLDFVEVSVRPGRTPKPAKLLQMKKRQRDSLAFSVLAGEQVLDSDPSEALELVKLASEALSAEFIVVRAPSSLRPAGASEKRIERALSALSDVSGATLLFEPSGLWQPPATRRLCRAWGVGRVLRVEDMAQEPEPLASAYIRVVQMGTGRSRLAKHLDAAAMALQTCDGVHVLVEGGDTNRVRSAFELALTPFEQDSVE
jgi:hypothetical protein